MPFHGAPSLIPFSILDEGHTGVALFMCLSGYLFAKLLEDKPVRYHLFLWNRILRLLPLLAVVILVNGVMIFVSGGNLFSYVYSVAKGVVYPSLPNGGWSITIEFHFYIVLPLLLWVFRKSKLMPLFFVLAAIALRAFIYSHVGEIQSLAYWTIIGRIDQFALGMFFYYHRRHITGRHYLVVSIIAGFMLFYWWFDRCGGFYFFPSYPSASSLWIVLPAIEGLVYSITISWYETSFTPPKGGLSGFIGHVGEYSYSIYLLHFFFVFRAARFIHERILDISNFYLACLFSLMFFSLMVPVGYLSFQFIESKFLRLRKRYIIQDDSRPLAEKTAGVC